MSDFKSIIIENIIRERDKEREREKIKKLRYLNLLNIGGTSK